MTPRRPRGLLLERQSPLWSVGRVLLIGGATVALFVAGLSVVVLMSL